MKPESPTPPRQATLGRLELRCPPLPQTLVEATNLIDQPEQLEVGPVTAMVQRDPIVVAKLLHIVNSAYYGLRRAINSVERAVVMLGPVAVAGIVVGMNMLKLNSLLESPASRTFDRLIRHSIASAYLVRFLLEGNGGQGAGRGSQKRLVRVGVSFTAGLLHDFGKIILVYNYPEEALELYERHSLKQVMDEPDVCRLEQLLFGCDHTEAGEYVARKLGFPESLTDVIRFHHFPESETGNLETDRLIRATAVANLVAKTMGYGLRDSVTWSDVTESVAWELLLQKDLTHYTSETLLEALKEEKESLDQYIGALMSDKAEQKGLGRTVRSSSQ